MPKRSRNKGQKKDKEEKVKEKIKAMIEKTQQLQQQREEEADVLKVQRHKLESLLQQSNKIGTKKLKQEIKTITRGYKDSIRNRKNKRKEKLQLRREQRRREKEEIKQQNYNTHLATIKTLPSRADINGSNVLNIYVDAWNMLSCGDVECRKKINRQKKQAIAILMTLLNVVVNNKNVFEIDYDIEMHCLFKGDGENTKNGNINVIYTGKGISVEDKLLDQFNKIENKNEMKCNLVITSDRELIYTVYKTGVSVMKASVFYKIMMKQNVANNNENREEKKEDDIADELAKHIASKMNLQSQESNNNTNNNPDVIDNDNNNPTDVMVDDGDDYTFNDNDEFDENDEIFDENMDDIDDD